MLRVVEDYQDWAKRYNIEVIEGACPVCGRQVRTEVPFATKYFRGLLSKDHGCGQESLLFSARPTERMKDDTLNMFLSEVFRED